LTTAALLLVLASAFLHAGWNVLLAGARDVEATTAVTLVVALVASAPFAIATWDVEPAGYAYAAPSAALELTYFVLLAYAYRTAELSVVYPVARGLAPVLVLLAAVIVLDEGTSPLEAGGVLLVCVGVLLVRGLRAPASRAALLGLAIAATIAAYTVIDKRGIEHASALAYQFLILAPGAVVYSLGVARIRGVAALRAALTPRAVVAAAAAFMAYLFVLLALRLADAAPVAAVRESGVVIAVALAAIFLGERVGRVRAAGAAVVVAGVILLSF
jgi:drug/metabolite transporter (DMT)-like permease